MKRLILLISGVILVISMQAYTVTQQVRFKSGSIYVGEQADMILYNSSGSSTTYVSNTSGYFNITVSAGTYDVVIKRHVNGNSYEWFQSFGFDPISGHIVNGNIDININSDKVLIVPTNYATIQDALNHIQDTGTVLICNGTYSVSGLNWKYKHIKLQGQSINGVIINNDTDDNVQAIRLDWSGINNQDIIQNIKFEYCLLDDAIENCGSAIALFNGASPWVKYCNFNSNKIQHGYSMEYPYGHGIGGALYVAGASSQTTSPKFEICSFTNNMTISANGGGAAALCGRAQFIGCTFTGNNTTIFTGNYPSTSSAGGAILINTEALSGDICFDGCSFTNNIGMYEAHDVYVYNCDNLDNLKFIGCNFNWSTDNYNGPLPSIRFLNEYSGAGPYPTTMHTNLIMNDNTYNSFEVGAVFFTDSQGRNSVQLLRNVFSNNEGTGYGFYLRYHGGNPSNPAYFKCDNNTFINILGKGLVLYEGVSYTVNNTIFENCGTGISWGEYETGHPDWRTTSLTTKNCLLNNTANYDYYGSTGHVLTQVSNQIDVAASLDTGFCPIWDDSIKSPCIDNGTPDYDNDEITWYTDTSDRDTDGSQMDIGAVPLLDGHIHSTHTFSNANNQVKYICFPGVVNCVGRENENTFDYVFNTFRENHLFYTDPIEYLGNLEWSYNQNTGQATSGTPPNIHLFSQYGFKVQLVSGTPLEKTIEYTGYHSLSGLNIGMPVPELNDQRISNHYIKAPLHSNQENCFTDPVTGVWYRKIYLGYDLDETMSPSTAYAAIWSKIIAVRASNWSSDRIPTGGPYNPNDPLSNYTNSWTGRVASMTPGSMLEVWYIDDEDVQFQLGGGVIPPEELLMYRAPEHFSYNEEMEYTPIYLTLDAESYNESNMPEEVAVYLNDECKGAAVIEEGQADIQAYIVDVPAEELPDLEFRLYNPTKGRAVANDFAIMNAQTNKYEVRKIKASDLNRYMQIKLSGDSAPITPAITALKGNYPNPFNPSTSIRFDLAKSGQVKLEIYNVKGQLVKTLVNGKSEAGSHSLEWNGVDNNGKATSSGIYYYKLTTDGKTLTNKMLMLK